MKFVIRNTKDGYDVYHQRWWGANQKIGTAIEGGQLAANNVIASYMLSLSTYDFFSIEGDCKFYDQEFR
jgi:hypothetical protein